MVRLRREDGSTALLDRKESIEVLTSDGLLGMVMFTDGRSVIHILYPGNPLFTAYCRAHRLGAASTNHHEPYQVRSAMK